jgi:hypothetical protein
MLPIPEQGRTLFDVYLFIDFRAFRGEFRCIDNAPVLVVQIDSARITRISPPEEDGK